MAILGKNRKNGQWWNTPQQLETQTWKVDEKEMKNRKTSKMDMNPLLKNGVFHIFFHLISLPIFDSIFQKNRMRNEIKNKLKMVTVSDTIFMFVIL